MVDIPSFDEFLKGAKPAAPPAAPTPKPSPGSMPIPSFDEFLKQSPANVVATPDEAAVKQQRDAGQLPAPDKGQQSSDEGFWSLAGRSFAQSAMTAGQEVIGGAAASVPTMLGGSTVAQQAAQLPDPNAADEVTRLSQQKIGQGWTNPRWWGVQIGSGVGASAPTAVLGAGGALAGGLTTGPVGAAVGGAAGGGIGMALQSLVPAYKGAMARGLSHEDALDEAIMQSKIGAVFGAAMGLTGSSALYGRTITGALRRPLTEALTKLGIIQPGLMTAQAQAQKAAGPGGWLTPEEVLHDYITGMAVGAAMHGATEAGSKAWNARTLLAPQPYALTPDKLRAAWEATHGGAPEPPDTSGVHFWPKGTDFYDTVSDAIMKHPDSSREPHEWGDLIKKAHVQGANITLPFWLADNNGKIGKDQLVNFLESKGALRFTDSNGAFELNEPNGHATPFAKTVLDFQPDSSGAYAMGVIHASVDPAQMKAMKGNPYGILAQALLEKAVREHATRITWQGNSLAWAPLEGALRKLGRQLGMQDGTTRFGNWNRNTSYLDINPAIASDIRTGMTLFSRGPGTTLNIDPHREGREALSRALDSFQARDQRGLPGGSQWVQTPEGGQGMYLRLRREGDKRLIDMANVDFERRGTGAFTNYLQHLEEQAHARGWHGVRVENIFNDRLPGFLEKRGYVKEPDDFGGPPSYRKEPQLLGEAHRPGNPFPPPSPGILAGPELVPAGQRIRKIIEELRKAMGMKVPVTINIHPTRSPGGSLGNTAHDPSGYVINLWLPEHADIGAEGLFSTAAHEFGHVVMYHFFDRAPIDVKNSIVGAFNNFRQNLPPGVSLNQLHLLRSTALDNYYGQSWYTHDQPLSSLLPEKQRYWAGFEEWFAENVSRWAAASAKPQGIVEKFFSSLNRRIYDVLQKFKARLPLERQLSRVNVTEAGAIRPAAEMKAWLDSFIKDGAPFAQDIFAAAQLRSLRKNQLAFDSAGEDGINAVPQTLSTGAGRGLLSRLFGTAIPNPQIPGGADRFNVFYKYMIGLPQLAKRNPHIDGLQRYREQVSILHLEKNSMMGEAESTLHGWRALLPKQADALGGLIDDYMNMTYRTPAEIAAKVRRLPTEDEFRAMVHANRVNDSGIGVFQRVVQDFDRMLERYKMILQQDAHGMEDPIASAKALGDIDQQMADLRKGPYFPAMRFGNHTLTVRDSAGKVVHFETFESQRYQRRAHEEALAQFPGHEVRSGYLAKDAAPLVGLPPGLLDRIGEKLSLSVTQRAALDELKFEYAPAQSFAHRFQTRKNIPGYSTDFLRAYANYMFHGANYFTRIKYLDMLTQSIKDVRSESLQIEQAVKRDQIANFMDQHLKMMMDPRPDFATLRSLMFHWALGASPAAATLNLSQTVFGTYPYLASKFGSDVKAIAAMANASRKLSTFYIKGKLENTTDPELKGISEAVKQGLISETQANTLAATADGRVLSQGFGGNRAEKAFNTFSRASQFFFEMTEQTNRRVAFRAAWDMAMADPGNEHVLRITHENKILYESLRLKGFTDQEARAFTVAKDAVESTQYVYAPYARPRFMQGPLLSSIFLFHSFTQNTLFQLWNNPGAAARSLILMAAAGGLMGLPGMEDVNGLARALAYHLFGKDFDLQDEVRKFVIDIMHGGGHVERPGQIMGDSGIRPDILLHGLSRVGYGIPSVMDMLGDIGGLGHIPFPVVDRHTNLSMGNILPFEPGPLLAPQITGPGAGANAVDSTALRQTQRASGALFGLGFSIYKFLESLQAPNTGPTTMFGQDLRKWEMILPTAMKNASQAFRFYQEGKARNAQGAAVVRFDPSEPEHMMEILGQAIGYRPERLSAQWDRITAEREAEAFWDLRKQYLTRSAWTAFQAKDTETYKSVLEGIKKFNRDLPPEARGKAITSDALRDSFRARATATAKTEAGIPQQRGNVPLARSVQRLYPEATPGAGRKYPPQGGALGK